MLPVCQCHSPWHGSNLQNTVRGGERQCVARSRMASVATKLAFGQDGRVTPPLVRVGGLERFCADAAVLGDNQLARLVARTAERSLLRLVEVEIAFGRIPEERQAVGASIRVVSIFRWSFEGSVRTGFVPRFDFDDGLKSFGGLQELDRSSAGFRSEEHTSELQSQSNLVCRLLLEKKTKTRTTCECHPIQ